MNSTKKQRGASLIGILFIGGILVFLGVVGAQVVPIYTEYRMIGKTINRVKEAASPAEVRANFDKMAQIDNIKSITGKDLVFTQEGAKTMISFAYTKEIHLAGPAYLLLKYADRFN